MVRVGDTLYLAAGTDGVFRLNNFRQSWERIEGDPLDLSLSLATDNTTLYLGTDSAIYRLNPDGEHFTRITPDNDWLNRNITVLAIEDSTIWAIRDSQLILSKDGGFLWHQIHPNGDIGIHSLAIKGNTTFVLTETHEVFYSTDGGKKWTRITKGIPNARLPAPTVVPLLFDKNTLYIGTITGVYRLVEGTDTWMSAGLDGLYTTSIVASQNTLYAGTWPNGVFRSTDGGKTWQNIGLKGVSVTTLAFFDNRLYVGSSIQGVFYTEDGRANWHPLNKGLTHIIE